MIKGNIFEYWITGLKYVDIVTGELIDYEKDENYKSLINELFKAEEIAGGCMT